MEGSAQKPIPEVADHSCIGSSGLLPLEGPLTSRTGVQKASSPSEACPRWPEPTYRAAQNGQVNNDLGAVP